MHIIVHIQLHIILLVGAALQAGFKLLIISSKDTYMLVLLVHFAAQMGQEI